MSVTRYILYTDGTYEAYLLEKFARAIQCVYPDHYATLGIWTHRHFADPPGVILRVDGIVSWLEFCEYRFNWLSLSVTKDPSGELFEFGEGDSDVDGAVFNVPANLTCGSSLVEMYICECDLVVICRSVEIMRNIIEAANRAETVTNSNEKALPPFVLDEPVYGEDEPVTPEWLEQLRRIHHGEPWINVSRKFQ